MKYPASFGDCEFWMDHHDILVVNEKISTFRQYLFGV